MVQMGVQIQMPHYMIIEQESINNISAVCVIESIHMMNVVEFNLA